MTFLLADINDIDLWFGEKYKMKINHSWLCGKGATLNICPAIISLLQITPIHKLILSMISMQMGVHNV